ncbi:MAG TPA: VWA domain-containing protein [Candidatus Sulfotelmatobacter sp.]|nr:VWA domain-containing protein [Candidatus Sulfotelmatobacter sp.]
MKIHSWLRASALCIAVTWLTAALLAQSSAPPAEQSSGQTSAPAQSSQPANAGQQTPQILTLRTEVRRVIVDVMVEDARGKPVKGLTVNEFKVLEDKQPQKILSFDVYNFLSPSISRRPNEAPLPPNFFVNIPSSPEHGPLYVMLYDLVNTEIEDQMRARGQILNFIRSMPDGTRFAIFVNSDGLHLVQGFTSDKHALYAALDPKHSRKHVPRIFLLGHNYGYGEPQVSLDELTFIGQYLDGIPGRKNLIWVAGTFPNSVYPREFTPAEDTDKIMGEMSALAQAEIAVFPINVRGVVVYPEGRTTGAVPNGGASSSSGPPGGGPGAPSTTSSTTPVAGSGLGAGSPIAQANMLAASVVNQGGASLSGDYTTQDALADATGGRAFYSDNNLTAILETATEDGGNYYTLTYAPPSREDNGQCHAIRVLLDQKQYRVSYRQSYCRVLTVSTATEPGAEAADASTVVIPLKAGDVLQANMRPGAPMVHDLLFSAHVRTNGPAKMANQEEMAQLQTEAEYFMTHRRNKPPKLLPPMRVQKYIVDYRVFDPQLKREAARSGNASLEFAMAAFDADGRTLNGIVNDGVPQLSSDPTENKAGLYRIRQSLIVPVNAVTLRVGVRDRASDHLGTLEVPLPLAPEAVANAAAPKP